MHHQTVGIAPYSVLALPVTRVPQLIVAFSLLNFLSMLPTFTPSYSQNHCSCLLSPLLPVDYCLKVHMLSLLPVVDCHLYTLLPPTWVVIAVTTPVCQQQWCSHLTLLCKALPITLALLWLTLLLTSSWLIVALTIFISLLWLLYLLAALCNFPTRTTLVFLVLALVIAMVWLLLH